MVDHYGWEDRARRGRRIDEIKGLTYRIEVLVEIRGAYTRGIQ